MKSGKLSRKLFKRRDISYDQAVMGFGALGGKARLGGHGGHGWNEEDDNF